MPKEDQPFDENEESTLDEERESEEAEENVDDETDVTKLQEKIANLEKGIQKLATQKGREAKEEPKTGKNSLDSEIVEELLLTKHPEAELVLDDLKETAEAKGVSILKLFRESKYFQGEAKALSDAKKSEEEAKSKIKQPTNGTPLTKTDVLATKPEDVHKLKPSEKLQWLKHQANKPSVD